MAKSQIRNLEFKFFSNFGKNYLTVDYTRNGEHNRITYVVDPKMGRSEKAVRKFMNS